MQQRGSDGPSGPEDLYAVLEVEPSASHERITSAYRRRVRELRPDTRTDDATAEKFVRVAAAYETLRDPVLRAAYDREHHAPARPARAAARGTTVVAVAVRGTTARTRLLRVGPVRVEWTWGRR